MSTDRGRIPECSPELPVAADPTERLILMGTVHWDPQGYARLCAFFGAHRPDLILVELSPFGLTYRWRHGRFLQRLLSRNLKRAAFALRLSRDEAAAHPRIAAIARQIGIPFEYLASARYARESKVRVVLADSSQFSRNWVHTWGEMLSEKNLRTLLSLPAESADTIDNAYRLAACRIVDDRFPAALELSGYGQPRQEREHGIAAKIRAALCAFRPHRPIYVGGWQHLVSGGRFKTLRDILGIGASRCFLLDRAPPALPYELGCVTST